MIFIGIDPGLDGAVAVINDRGSVVWAAVAPTIGKAGGRREFDEQEMRVLFQRALLEANHCHGSIRVALELVGSRPGEGHAQSFRFGMGWGLWRGILVGLGLRYELLRPQAWQKTALADVPGDDAKAKAEWAAKARHPRFCKEALPRLATTKKRRQGVYDALGIAEGLRRASRTS